MFTISGASTAAEPTHAADTTCYRLEVVSVTGPTQLQSGSPGSFAVKFANPNLPGTCNDDGVIVEISFNGTVEAFESMDPDEGIVCSRSTALGLFASVERCVGSSFPDGASATIRFRAHIDGSQDRISARASTLQSLDRVKRNTPEPDLMVTTTPANMPAAAPGGTAALPSLKPGASGDTVSTLQWLLRHHGQDVDVDGDFGDETAGAVKAFQTSRGITPADGTVNARTWQAMFVTLRKGTESDAVSALQQQLNAQGADITIDGDFGDETDGAVREFQRKRHLTVDGEVGPETWSALLSGV
jgi:peptidoglycan hydrolase-like protein with peptidoglycan-binding domain